MPIKKAYKETTVENIRHLIEYLNSISGKPLSIGYIRRMIFMKSWKDKDIASRNKSQIQAASKHLEYIISSDLTPASKDTVQTIIADLKEFVEQVDNEPNTSFILISPNTQISPIHFSHSKDLFYKNELSVQNESRYKLDVLTLYSLRLALEKRVLGFLGIDFLLNSKNHPIGFSQLYPIVRKLNNIIFGIDVNWDEIEKMNKWLNHHIHRHMRPYPWVIHQAFEVLKPLFLKGEKIINNKRCGSIYLSTYVEDEEKLHAEIRNQLINHFSGVIISWKNNREIMKGSKA